MKPYRILAAPLFFGACVLAVVTMPTAHAREATDYERFCLATMGQIESTLAAHLPGDCKIVATHPSPLGQRFAHGQIRDAWISRNGKVVAKVVMFTWPLPDDPLLSGATVSQVRLETDRDGKKVVLGIAVIGEDTQLVGDVVNVVNRSTETAPLPKLDGRSAKGLELECSLVQATFAVGEPVNIWCTVKNTTDSTKPVGWHPFGGGHFCQVQGDKPGWGGLLPTVVPHLDRPIMITSRDVPGYVLFVPPHESIQILLTHKEDRPGKFKGRAVYDPVDPRDGTRELTKDGPPWKDELLFSNEFEYEVVAAGQ